MHFWGLTIDTVTTIIIVLAIGLTVDYSAHLGHAFMISKKGNRNGIFISLYILSCNDVFFIFFHNIFQSQFRTGEDKTFSIRTPINISMTEVFIYRN